jgi:hypothetical protein
VRVACLDGVDAAGESEEENEERESKNAQHRARPCITRHVTAAGARNTSSIRAGLHHRYERIADPIGVLAAYAVQTDDDASRKTGSYTASSTSRTAPVALNM